MTDLQQWVNKKYPTKEEKVEVSRLYLSEPTLVGELDLSEFTQLYSILISHSLDQSKLIFLNQPQVLNITKLKNAQWAFDLEFPQAGACRGEFDREEEKCYDEDDEDSTIISERELKNQGLARSEIRKINLFEAELEGQLVINDFPQLNEINLGANMLTSLVFINCSHLKQVDCRDNLLTQLPTFSQSRMLIELDISHNKLTETLELNNFLKLERLCCSGNRLINLKLNDCPNLSVLWCAHNQMTDLKIFSNLKQVKYLDLRGNRFTGSLKILQNLTRLISLNISNTNISSGLEYLPFSLLLLYYKKSPLEKDLEPYKGQWKKWKENWRKDQQLSHPSKRGWKSQLEGVSIAPFIPDKKTINLSEHYNITNYEYKKIERSEDKVNHWKKTTILPTKLYNIEKYHSRDKLVATIVEASVEKTEAKNDLYAILSYVCGPYDCEHSDCYQCRDFIYQGLKKSLAKSVQALKFINQDLIDKINYLWVDQLCINQNDLNEKAEEIRRMHQNYNNAAVTLIAIQCDLGKKNAIDVITSSKWFTRSWTFQEGWLSKHTIFMFDDCLVDGRELAVDWVWRQPSYSEYAIINTGEKEQASVKVATPVGWVYFKEGYQPEDKISLTLSQVLRGVRQRNRSVSIDGIYSILGLLPYGSQVKTNYNEKWGHNYTQRELLEALYDVMKAAWDNDYGEVLGWHGLGYSLIPQIRSIQKGSTETAGGIFIKRKPQASKNLVLTEKEVVINAFEFSIEKFINQINRIEGEDEGFLIDGGLCTRIVQVKIANQLVETKLWGSRTAFQQAKIGQRLLIPDPNDWESNIPFGLLALETDNHYRRIGLVEIRNGIEKLTVGTVKELKISIATEDYLEFKEIETLNHSSDIEQSLGAEREQLATLIRTVKNGQLELVDALLEKQKEVLNLEIELANSQNQQNPAYISQFEYSKFIFLEFVSFFINLFWR